jgi:Fe-Mn family superoxide dismutase
MTRLKITNRCVQEREQRQCLRKLEQALDESSQANSFLSPAWQRAGVHSRLREEGKSGLDARQLKGEGEMTTYALPDLTYDYGALEPHISGQIMELHHSKHHAAYITGANTALEKLEDARSKDDFGLITMLEKNLAFHTSGHVLHSLFWNNLSPSGGDRPTGALAQEIDRDFGSFDAFMNQLSHATNSVQGSGWGALAYEPASGKLVVQQIYDHQGNVVVGSAPLLSHRCLGARVLPAVQERPRRLREGNLEYRQLAGRREPVRSTATMRALAPMNASTAYTLGPVRLAIPSERQQPLYWTCSANLRARALSRPSNPSRFPLCEFGLDPAHAQMPDGDDGRALRAMTVGRC